MAQRSIDFIRDFEFRRHMTQMRSFLGACSLYRKVVKNFAKGARPLTNTARENSYPNWEESIKEQFHAFEALKQRLVTAPVLALLKAGKPPLIDTGASTYGLGVTMIHIQDDEPY